MGTWYVYLFSNVPGVLPNSEKKIRTSNPLDYVKDLYSAYSYNENLAIEYAIAQGNVEVTKPITIEEVRLHKIYGDRLIALAGSAICLALYCYLSSDH
jgi:hypothetical protein